MSRSYLSKQQVKFERDSLDYLEEKHRKLIDHQDAVYKLWNADNCHFEGVGCAICQLVRDIVDADVAWSFRDLERRRGKVERLERETSRKRRVKRSIKQRRKMRKLESQVGRE